MTKQKVLQNLKKARAGRRLLLPGIFFSAGLLALTAPDAPAQKSANAMAAGAASHLQTMTYELYAGGINAVKAEFDIEEQKGRYRMALAAQTKGFLGKLVPWRGTFETEGWRFPDGTERPELHQSTAVWDGEEDKKIYKYGKDGSFQSLKSMEAGKDNTPESLSDELVQGTTDALTASLQAMQAVAGKGTCEGSDEVFDGSRRFRLHFRHIAEDILEQTRYNVYEGAAIRCEVEVEPVAGKWHEKPRGWASIQEQGRAKGSLPTVWLAKIDEDGPAVPVKMRVKTDYGTLFMHMTDYRNGDKQMAMPVDN